jgi:hypothetical protein
MHQDCNQCQHADMLSISGPVFCGDLSRGGVAYAGNGPYLGAPTVTGVIHDLMEASPIIR